MNVITAFHGSIAQKNKLSASYPDFAGVLSIATGMYNCAVWLNRSKKGRLYLGLRLTKQGLDSKDNLKLALWEAEDASFQNTLDVAGLKLLFAARIIQDGSRLELSIGPATGSESDSLRQAIERLPIPVLWTLLGLPGRVRANCTVRSPLRDDDRVPSFSIYSGGRRFKDHGSGERGDAFDFFKLITKLESKTAYERFLELAGFPPQR